MTNSRNKGEDALRGQTRAKSDQSFGRAKGRQTIFRMPSARSKWGSTLSPTPKPMSASMVVG